MALQQASRFENYPSVDVPVDPRPTAGAGAGRGSLVGMVTAAATLLASLPYHEVVAGDVTGGNLGFVLILVVVAAFLGLVPGLLVGATLGQMARAGGKATPLRLAGGAAAAIPAALVTYSMNLGSVPGAMVALVCGLSTAVWVGYGARPIER